MTELLLCLLEYAAIKNKPTADAVQAGSTIKDLICALNIAMTNNPSVLVTSLLDGSNMVNKMDKSKMISSV